MYKDFRCVDQHQNTEVKREENSCPLPGVVCAPVMECPEERVCHREICHEVPHIVPVNTRIINHHIYRHTFEPCYTCCEENEVCNVFEPRCKF